MLNRSAGRIALFRRNEDYAAFERVRVRDTKCRGYLVEYEWLHMDGRPAARQFGHFDFQGVSHGGRDQQTGCNKAA